MKVYNKLNDKLHPMPNKVKGYKKAKRIIIFMLNVSAYFGQSVL